MKKSLAVAMALASSTVLAQDLQLGDLNFFQKAGSYQLNTQLSMGQGEFSEKNEDGTYDIETKQNIWSNSLTYGVSDKFRIGLGVDYALKNEQENTGVPAGDTKSKAIDDKGLSDFSIVSAYRLMSDKVYVDLLADLTIAMGDREEGSSDDVKSKDGNFKQGHHSLDLGAAVGQKIDKFEWRAGAGVSYHMSGDYDALSVEGPKTTVDTDSRMDMVVSAQAQYRPMTKLAIALGVEWTKVGEQELEAKVDGEKIEVTEESSTQMAWTAEAKYNLSDSILVNAGYSIISLSDLDVKQKNQDGTSKSTIEDNKASVVTIGASFLF